MNLGGGVLGDEGGCQAGVQFAARLTEGEGGGRTCKPALWKHPIWIPAIKTEPSTEDDTRSCQTGLSVNRMCILHLEKWNLHTN